MCPGNKESGGKRLSGKTRKGNAWLRQVLIEVAHVASRTKATYLVAQYRRIAARRGEEAPLVALGHTILVSISEITQPGQTPVGPKDFAEWIGKITTVGTHRSFVRAQRPSVALTPAHTILSVNGPTALGVFGTNNCPSQTLASANETSLQSVADGSNAL